MDSTLLLTLAFLFLAGLVLLALLDARLPWRIKAALIVASALAAALFAYGVQGLRGYPVPTTVLPERFSLLWSVVREPSPGDPGAIHAWVRVPGEEPRVFILPYSRPLHERMEQARTRAKDGEEVTMETRENTGAEPGNAARGLPSVPDFVPPPNTTPSKTP